MIDFHSHILPNVDDGSKSVEETFNLIKEAKNVGFNAIISTSHYIENYYEVGVEERTTWIYGIMKALRNDNINFEIYLGNEAYFSENLIKLINEKKVATINGSKYLLFEFAMNVKPMNIYDVIYEIIENKYIPILAHPERYSFIQKEPNLIEELIESGVLMQCNYGSFIGQYGEKAKIISKKMLENDMVHFLGTDVHKQNSIYPKIPEILEVIEKMVGQEKLNELTKINPKLVLENKNIEISDPLRLKFTFGERIQLKKN